jgi:hypothetical protein
MSDKQQIGDPMALAVQTGIIGERRPITSRDERPREETVRLPEKPREAKEKTPSTQKWKHLETTSDTEKKTITFYAEMAHWLEIQAAIERRDMSLIVDEALGLYRRLKNGQA